MNLPEQVKAGRIVASWHKITQALAMPVVKGRLGSEMASTGNGKSWTGGASYTDALALADTGWDAGARAAEAHPAYVELFATALTRSTSFGWDDTEGELSAERLLSGSDFYLRKAKRQPRTSRGCRVIVALNGRSDISADAFLQRAIDIAAGIYQIELAKHDVELWAVASSSQGTHRTAIKVHETGQTINLAKVAFWCGHPAAFRRLIFGLRERADEKVQQGLLSYGISDGLSPEVLKGLNLPPWEGDNLVFSTIQSNDVSTTRKTIVESFHKVLEQLSDSTHEPEGWILR